MKKIVIASCLYLFGGIFGIIIVVMVIVGGNFEAVTDGAEVEDAYKYFSFNQELGVPWDLTLLVDTYTVGQGISKISETDPLRTSLNFCTVQVELVPDKKDEIGLLTVYTGADEIMEKFSIPEQSTVNDVMQILEEYDEEHKTISKISVIPEERWTYVVTELYSGYLSKDDLDYLIELYKTKYVYDYYMEASDLIGMDWQGSFELPDMVVGEVYRRQIIEIAVQLIDAPYLLGGKSPYAGAPQSALDCSGFVDWVYMQAFGSTISGGYGGTAVQLQRCEKISSGDLQVGDLGFYYYPGEVPAGGFNHVGIYVGQIDGKDAFIHCGGPYWGYPGRDSGRVALSINDKKTKNLTNPLGGSFNTVPMNPCDFKIFARPRFTFLD